MTARLDISIGPVQGFVAQSRRTRDFWGSSYLLSFLSAHAMHGAQEGGGRIIQPCISSDDRLYRWVDGDRNGEAPRIASLPNHFVVEVTGDPVKVASDSKVAFVRAWKRVCDAVRRSYVDPAVAEGQETAEVWKRQTENFWEFVWAVGDDASGGSSLARRKHWHSHSPPEEPGDKCTVMHDLQEISGWVRARNRARQDRFWSRLRERLGALDLAENERLCAVALTKRLFPKVSDEALGWEVGTTHWPSTIYVGAIPWIRSVIARAPGRAREFAEAISRTAGESVLTEHHSLPTKSEHAKAGDFPRLDANCFHLRSFQGTQLARVVGDGANVQRELTEKLEGIYEVAGRPASFYALLTADGDRLGKLLRELGRKNAGRVGNALATFTSQVPRIVGNHDGVTIYAGGDDVFAMLPVAQALRCASDLARTFESVFEEQLAGRNQRRATLSAGVVFAPVQHPLSAVIAEARRLLDDIAKDANGRDSLAVAVLKRGGLNCQWASTWTRSGAPVGHPKRQAVDVIRDLVGLLRASGDQAGLSSSLIYRIRDTLTRLCGWNQWEPGDLLEVPSGIDVKKFLRAEIISSVGDDPERSSGNHNEDTMSDIICRALPTSRAKDKDPPGTKLGVDALLLARFLATLGEEN